MAKYDEVFAELQAKHAALLAVIAQHPEIQAEVRDAWAAQPDDVRVDDPTDEARANALAQVLRQAAQAVGAPAAEEEGESE